MFKLIKRLDPEAEFNDLPPKPKAMHWRTYDRLAERYEEHEASWNLEPMHRFGIGLR
jgi:hypothetical protein